MSVEGDGLCISSSIPLSVRVIVGQTFYIGNGDLALEVKEIGDVSYTFYFTFLRISSTWNAWTRTIWPQVRSFTCQEEMSTFTAQLKLMRKILKILFSEAKELILSRCHSWGRLKRFKRLEKFLELKEHTSKSLQKLRIMKVLKTLIPSCKFLMVSSLWEKFLDWSSQQKRFSLLKNGWPGEQTLPLRQWSSLQTSLIPWKLAWESKNPSASTLQV